MKPNVPHAARLLVLSAAVAALASCGGGGGGGGGGGLSGPPPTTPVALSSGNMQPVTDEVLNMSFTFASVGASQSSNLGDVPLAARPKAHPRRSPLLGLLRQQLGASSARSPMANSFVPLDAPVPCDNGPAGQFQIQHPDATTTTVSFTNCSSGGETINGTISVTNIATPAAGETTGHVSHNLTFAQANFPTLTSSGDFDIDHTTAGTVTTDKLTGGPVTLSDGSDTAILSGFTITSTFDSSSNVETDSFGGTVATTVIGGTVTVATPTPFETVPTGMFPHTGQLIITGASNGAVRFTVLGDDTLSGDQVTLEADPQGDGTFEAPVGFTWASL